MKKAVKNMKRNAFYVYLIKGMKPFHQPTKIHLLWLETPNKKYISQNLTRKASDI